ncbi:hypothetical protein Q8F55_000041 [Vanrija albida]|uniref:F-box domain-containing protein n=1 Tax=Vanrija albida TaxID=181172 RepID=A0ABR3QCR3_9TREE
MPVTIDHTAYPHLIELILHYADRKTQVSFSSTCKLQRKRVQRVALHHPQGKGLSVTTPDCKTDLPWFPQVARVLDLGGRCDTYATRRCLTQFRRDQFFQLDTVRRAPLGASPYLPPTKSHYRRLGDVLTLVDYIDLDRVLPCHWKGINLVSCRKHHVLHLRWHDGSPASTRVPDYHLCHYGAATRLAFTVVLWPHSTSIVSAPKITEGHIIRFIEGLYHRVSGQSLTVVAPAEDYVTIQLACSNIPIISKSHDEWLGELGEEKEVVGQWIPWPTEAERDLQAPATALSSHSPTPPGPVTIDYAGYPHIIDLILEHADRKTKLAFSATCKFHRLRLVEHGALNLNPNGPRIPWIPRLVKVLDLEDWSADVEDFDTALVRRGAFWMVQTIRRAFTTTPFGQQLMKRHFSLATVATVVDYIDLDRAPGGSINLGSCGKHHVLHLRWDEESERSAAFPAYRFGEQHALHERRFPCEPYLGYAFTVILWPRSTGDVPAADGTKREVCNFVEGMYTRHLADSITVVAPTKDYLDIRLENTPATFVTHDEWYEKLGDQRHTVGQWMGSD